MCLPMVSTLEDSDSYDGTNGGGEVGYHPGERSVCFSSVGDTFIFLSRNECLPRVSLHP